MRKFIYPAVAAAALAFMAPSPAHAQIITSSSYYGGYTGGYLPYGGYGNSIAIDNLGIGIGVSNYGGYGPGYYGGYNNYYGTGYGYRNYNSYYGGTGYGYRYNNGGYARGGFGGRRR